MDPTPTASHYATLNRQAETIGWTGGSIQSGRKRSFTSSNDLPDWSAAIPAGFETLDTAGNITGYLFTLRQTPSIQQEPVPEPGTLALTGLGMLGMGVWLKRRKKR